MIVDASLQRAMAFLEERFGLDVLWLFGSEAQGTTHPESDVDLAALFRQRPDALDVLGARGDLEEILGREVDLVDLDRASPILAMQVLQHGRLLVDRDPRRRIAFFVRTLNLYEDLKIQRRDVERRLFERIAGGRP
ncbi:MAG TPA: nucleotidyltransferase domain-containing protein [Thermoanaerobaculia bacterium]